MLTKQQAIALANKTIKNEEKELDNFFFEEKCKIISNLIKDNIKTFGISISLDQLGDLNGYYVKGSNRFIYKFRDYLEKRYGYDVRVYVPNKMDILWKP